MRAEKIYRIGNWFYKRNLKIISSFFDYLNLVIHNSWIPSKCEIGVGTKFAYSGIGVVINGNSKIGEFCIIGQGITVGMKSDKKVPVIGDYVYIGPGARILGGIYIGNYSIIGANAVVISDVPPYTIVAGIPAKIIRKIDNSFIKEKYNRFYLENEDI